MTLFVPPTPDPAITASIERMVIHAIKHRLLCRALIDQNRYIGDDPVGYGCSQPSTETVWTHGVNFRLCAEHAEMFRRNDPRLTVPISAVRAGGEE